MLPTLVYAIRIGKVGGGVSGSQNGGIVSKEGVKGVETRDVMDIMMDRWATNGQPFKVQGQ